MIAAAAPVRIGTALLLAAAAAALLSRAPRQLEIARGEACRAESDYHVERGEALLHGVPLPGFGRAMPSYSVPNAVLCGHLPAPAAAAVRFAALLACAALVFALGARLYSPLSGAAAALLFALPPPESESGERWLYTLAVLLAAWFLVRRAREPSRAATARLAAALGATLLMLSSLCLFPFLAALYERLRDRGTRAFDAALLCLAPFLVLLPWSAALWAATGRFTLFEDGRVDENLLAGALGFVRTMGIGDSRRMLGLAQEQGALAWAAGQVLSHPLGFLAALLERARFAAGLHPFLLLGTGASAVLWRGVEDRRQLALLAGYLLGIHLLMPVQENYFVPAWPLLAVLASGLLAGRGPAPEGRLGAASRRAASAALALLLLASAGTLGLAAAYPLRSRGEALARALAASPDDAWLRSERGMRLLRDGRPAEARLELARALALAPSRDRELAHAWAVLASGAPAAGLWERRVPGRPLMLSDIRERLLLGIYFALTGRPERGAAEEALALAYRRSGEAPGGASVARGGPVPALVLEIIASWPPAARPAVVAFFTGLPGFEFTGREAAEGWLDMASTAGSAGRRGAALEMLAFTEKLRLDARGARKLAAAYRDAGDHARARAVLRKAGPVPADAGLLLDMAARAGTSGRAEALEDLAFAESLKLDRAQLKNLALAYRDIGSWARCLAVMKRPELAGPEGADMLLDTAALARKAGAGAEALAMLAFVEASRPDGDRLRRLALAYDDAGEPRRAIAAMRRTDMRRPGDFLMILGLASKAAREGGRSAALEALAFAGGLPLDGPSLRKLALAHRDLGSYPAALAAMKGAAEPGDAGLLLDLAVRAGRDGRRGDALASLALAESLPLDPDARREVAAGYRVLGEIAGSARVRRFLGDEDGLAVDRAEAAAATGDAAAARARLSSVNDERLADEDARRFVLLLQGLGDRSAALAAVERRVRARPRDARWRSDAGVLRSLLGRREEAAADWAAAIALNPDGLAPYLSLGSLYASMERRTEALDVYGRALSRRRSREYEGLVRRIVAERRKLLAPVP